VRFEYLSEVTSQKVMGIHEQYGIHSLLPLAFMRETMMECC
jgi:hypothetical protein